MNRTWIATLAVVALLAQSVSMAWASTRVTMPDEPAATEQAAPCHGQADGASSEGGTKADCCAGDCILMCGGAPLPAPILAVPAPTTDGQFSAAPVPALLASHSLSPFRPPAR